MWSFFPDWIPEWVQILFLVAVAFFVICYFLMPFAVFGIKGRLKYLDRHLEDIQAQLSVILKRLPETKNYLEVRPRSLSLGKEEKASVVEKNRQHKAYNKPIFPITAKPKEPFHNEAQRRNNSFVANEPKINDLEGKSTCRQTTDAYRQERFSGDQNMERASYTKTEYDVYDPPAENERKKSEDSSKTTKKRAEPILRWPPR